MGLVAWDYEESGQERQLANCNKQNAMVNVFIGNGLVGGIINTETAKNAK